MSETENSFFRIKQQFDDQFDKYGFLLAFLVGAAGIAWLKYANFSQFWVTAYPAIVMVIYAIIIKFCRRTQLREDQSGDNLYYLGFLYTLVSLSGALIQFNSKGATALIIENFGIALATTILGLIFRVVFNQMRHDPVEIEREARLELADAATRMRIDLLEVTQVMKSMLLAAQQQTKESIGEAQNEFLDNTKRFNNTTSKFVKSIEALVSRVDEVQPPTDLLEKKLEPAIQSIQLAAEEIRNRAKGDERIVTQLSTLIENAITASQQLENKVKLIADESDKANNMISQLHIIGDQFAKSGTSFQEAAQHVSNFGETQRTAQEKLNSLLAQSTTEASSSFTTMNEKIAGALSEINNASVEAVAKLSDTIYQSIRAQKSAFLQLEQSLEKTLAHAKDHNDGLAHELGLSRDYTNKVHLALVSMTESLTEKLATDYDSTPVLASIR